MTPEPHIDDFSEQQRLRAENENLRASVRELRSRLNEPEDIVRAIRLGEVDAFVVSEPRGERIYSLRSADVLYRRMIEDMKEGAVALDASGVVTYCNGYFADLINADRAAVIGASLFQFVPAESRSFFEALTREATSGTTKREITLRTKEGESVAVLATMNRIDLEGVEIFCLILTDLSEQKRRELLLQEGRRKDEFLAMLAHELRNPIAPIRNAVQVLRLERPEPSKLRWATGVIDRQVTQLSRLVDDLLDVSRITQGKIRLEMAPVDVATVVAHAVETARPLIDVRQQELTITASHRPLGVQGDVVRLSQVISNLLNNAAKFTPEHGHIWLSAEQLGDWVQVTVRDNGVGIAGDMLAAIFDMFSQADASNGRLQGGLGIGLTLVRSLVELHGGTVEARSNGAGTGSEFVVRLPTLPVSEPREAPRDERPLPSMDGAAPRRLLIIDDNVDAAESMMVWLRLCGHDVRIAHDGNSALKDALAFRPHVVLLDIGLPGKSGYDVARDLRRLPELAGVLLIAVTGYGQEEDRRASAEAGFDQHWVKPVDPELLADLLTSLEAGAGSSE